MNGSLTPEELRERKLKDLRRAIQVGIDQADKGDVSPFTEETLKEAKAAGRKRLRGKA